MLRPVRILILLLMALLTVGCARPVEEIVTYEKPKSESGLDNLNEPPPFLKEIMAGGNEPAGPTIPARMVVAITERDDKVWFFKITGPADEVAATEPDWRAFLETVEFQADEPLWKLPDSWSAGADSPDRFATLYMTDDDPPLEMAVTVFSMQFAPLMNVNRWRGQIMLPPVDQLESELPTVAAKGFEFQLYDETGLMVDSAVGGARDAAEPDIDGEPVQKVAFEVPDGWQQDENTMSFIRARLSKMKDDQEVRITVSEMSTQNGWADVVSQWSAQAGFPELSEEDANERTSKVTVAGETVNQIRLINEDEEVVTGVIGAMLNRGDINWFFKLHGEKQLVVESAEEFTAFLEGFQFEQ